jgi:hypothetical protein
VREALDLDQDVEWPPALLPGGRIAAPKGIYRFRTLDEANRQQAAWLAEAMAEARAARREGNER